MKFVAIFVVSVVVLGNFAEAKHEDHHHKSHNKHGEKKSKTTVIKAEKAQEPVRKHSMGMALSRKPPFSGVDKTLTKTKGSKVPKDLTKGKIVPIIDRGIGLVLADYPPSAGIDTKLVHGKGHKPSTDAKEKGYPVPDGHKMGTILADYPPSAGIDTKLVHGKGKEPSKDAKEKGYPVPDGHNMGTILADYPPSAGIDTKLVHGKGKEPSKDAKEKGYPVPDGHNMGTILADYPPSAGIDTKLVHGKGKKPSKDAKEWRLPIIDRGMGVILANYPPSVGVDTKLVDGKGKKNSKDAKGLPIPMIDRGMGLILANYPPFSGVDTKLAHVKGKKVSNDGKGLPIPMIDRGIGLMLANYPQSAGVDTKLVNRKGKKMSTGLPIPMINRGMGMIFANYPPSGLATGLSKDAKESSEESPTLDKSIGMELLSRLPPVGGGNKLGLGDGKLPKDVKTKENKTTTIHGNYKTVTTYKQHFKLDKKNKTKMIGQSVESVTSPVNGTSEKKRPGLFFDFRPFDDLLNDESEPQCSPKKPCKKKGTYCNKIVGQCEATKKPGSKCDQPDQCSPAHGGQQFSCIWGKCLLASNTGYSGRFCQDDKECGSEDMQCVPQSDISRISDICVSKPAEGQTCGAKVSVGFWPFRRSVLRRSPCQKGLECVRVGYSGRMVCRPALDKDDEGMIRKGTIVKKEKKAEE